RSWTWTWPWDPTTSTETLILNAPSGIVQQPLTFLAFGDIQNGLYRFGDLVQAMNTETTAEFIISMGDLAQFSTSAEYDEIDVRFSELELPIYPVPGNHDIFRPDEYQRRFGRANFSFVHRGARFTGLDSASARLGNVVWDWTSTWFALGIGQFHVVFSHIAAFEFQGIRNAQWSSRREARKFVSMATENSVDLLLFGHLHTHDAYTLGGIPTHISGGAGAIPEKWDSVGRHYLRVTVDPLTQAAPLVEIIDLGD
ncbi:MAG: metallophosphoesterase, partial [Bdellovibrionota bacterium]